MKETIKLYIERIGTIISVSCLVIGIFGCLCEVHNDNWFKYLIIFGLMVFFGIVGIIAFDNISNIKNFFLWLWCMFWLGIDNFVKYSKHKIKRVKEFNSIIRYYRNRNYTYRRIFKIMIFSKLESELIEYDEFD